MEDLVIEATGITKVPDGDWECMPYAARMSESSAARFIHHGSIWVG
jgi:hypothetical protein